MSRKIPKIAFLLGTIGSNGGIERVTTILADQIIEKGLANVHAIGFQPHEAEMVYDWNKKVTFYDLRTKKGSMQTGIFPAIPRLRRYLRKQNIDVLIACGHIFAPLGGLSTLGTKTKLVYWSHSSFYGEQVHAYKKFNEHFGAIFANTVISLTKADEQNYRQKTMAKKVIQIYNPIDDKLLVNTPPYNPDTNKIISVGRLTEQKKIESYLLEVAKMVLDKNPEYTWHIYGKGELENIIKDRINKMGLTGRVILEGNVTNLYELYSNYSIMVMTSAYEGFPMTLLEGMSKRLPLISFDVQTGPNEIIINDVNGFLINPFKISDMADKINILINNRDLRIKLSSANSSLLNDFKMQKIITKWTALLNEMND